MIKLKLDKSLTDEERLIVIRLTIFIQSRFKFLNVNTLVVSKDPELKTDHARIKRRNSKMLKKMFDRNVNPYILTNMLNQRQYEVLMPEFENVEQWSKLLLHELIHLQQMDSGKLLIIVENTQNGPIESYLWMGYEVDPERLKAAQNDVQLYLELPWELEAYSMTPILYREYLSKIKELFGE